MNSSPPKKKILLLWSPLADYTIACFKKLAEKNNVELYMIHQPGQADAPYDGFDLGFFRRVFVYQKENERQLEDFCMNLHPDVIMMASWNYPFYMSVARKSKRKGSYVISSFDGQWRSTLKQRMGILISPFFLKPAIHNFFVPGDRQADFARKLGYNNPLQGYYSARTDNFNNKVRVSLPTKFIFVGRLVPDKGVDQLIEAYKDYRRMVSHPWDLIIAGKGKLRALFDNINGVDVKEFIQPGELPGLLSQTTCLILPSTFEPWGVVIHEAVSSGLSVICSHACGASTMFVRDGQNGYIVHPDKISLMNAMKKMSSKSQEELERMSTTSRQLGSLWTTEKWAEYLYQNICAPAK